MAENFIFLIPGCFSECRQLLCAFLFDVQSPENLFSYRWKLLFLHGSLRHIMRFSQKIKIHCPKLFFYVLSVSINFTRELACLCFYMLLVTLTTYFSSFCFLDYLLQICDRRALESSLKGMWACQWKSLLDHLVFCSEKFCKLFWAKA